MLLPQGFVLLVVKRSSATRGYKYLEASAIPCSKTAHEKVDVGIRQDAVVAVVERLALVLRTAPVLAATAAALASTGSAVLGTIAGGAVVAGRRAVAVALPLFLAQLRVVLDAEARGELGAFEEEGAEAGAEVRREELAAAGQGDLLDQAVDDGGVLGQRHQHVERVLPAPRLLFEAGDAEVEPAADGGQGFGDTEGLGGLVLDVRDMLPS